MVRGVVAVVVERQPLEGRVESMVVAVVAVVAVPDLAVQAVLV